MRKLLKYDMSSISRVWGIASLAMLGVAALGGLCLRTLVTSSGLFESESFFDIITAMSLVLGIFFSYLAFLAYALLVTIFVLRRFYCHFFTDEGYLTFTLPVKRHQLLTSKLLMGVFYNLLTLMAAVVVGCVFFTVGLAGTPVDTSEIFGLAHELMYALTSELDAFASLYLLEGILLLLAYSVFGTLFSYLCITIGAIIAKRHKILAAIGIYYGGTMVLSFLMQIGSIVMFPSAMVITEPGTETGVLAIMLAVMFVFVAALAVTCYCVTLRLLNRKLNLA